MGATFGSLRDRVSAFIGNLTQSEFWGGEGSSVEVPDLEKGDATIEMQYVERSVPDTSGAIQVFEGAPFLTNWTYASVRYGIPENTVTQWIDLDTRQRSLTIELECPLIIQDYIANENGEIVSAASDFDPSVTIYPLFTEEYKYYQNIVIDALPYHPTVFKVTNVQVVAMRPKWDSVTKKYLVRIHFRGPNNNLARFKFLGDPALPSLYQPPPP